MKGDAGILKDLNELLTGELTAVDQYLAHSRMYRDWGYAKLFEQINHEMQEEQTHADALIERILFLEGVPDLSSRLALNIGQNVPAMFRNDLDVEYRVVAHLRRVIGNCETAGDYRTREILLGLLKDTEDDHTHWLETQLHLIAQIGLQNYLQSQL
ncbi:MAG: bacterioferritin [Gammaproteobacteria bacterium]|nr:bacterioferritin [Gammaproteobacteria bacterium]